MSTRLEQFMRDNREGFDADEPNPKLWNKIEKELCPPANKKVFKMNFARWSAAAAIVILLGAGALYVMNERDNRAVVGQQENNNGGPSTPELLEEINPNYAKEVYHFTQLIELKQTELKQIQKDQPELYNKFLADITRLDSSYNALQKQLPENPNREQLLEAMIQNLRLQTELLNQQLLIIQKIKHSKSNSDENNSKSI